MQPLPHIPTADSTGWGGGEASVTHSAQGTGGGMALWPTWKLTHLPFPPALFPRPLCTRSSPIPAFAQI